MLSEQADVSGRRPVRNWFARVGAVVPRAWRAGGLGLVVTMVRLYGLAALSRVASWAPRSPMRLLGMTVHFGDFETFVRLFDEVFTVEPYAVDLPAGAKIVDAGANIGLAVLYFKRRCPEAEIIAFEPEATNFELLSANVHVNGLTQVSLHQAALTDATEPFVSLYVEPGKSGSVLATLEAVHGAGYGGAQQVTAVRLSDYVAEEVDLLKLDVEGTEEAVIEDLVVTGRLALIRAAVIEYHQSLGTSDPGLDQFVSRLEDEGFKVRLSLPALAAPTIYAER